jgi:hypothetical protein
MAGSFMYRPAPDHHCGAGSSRLRSPVLLPRRCGASASGITEHHALLDLLDGSVGRCLGVVPYVFLCLPPSPARLTAPSTPSTFSRVLPVVRTSPSDFLAFLFAPVSQFQKSGLGLLERRVAVQDRRPDSFGRVFAKTLAVQQIVMFGIRIVLTKLQDDSSSRACARQTRSL